MAAGPEELPAAVPVWGPPTKGTLQDLAGVTANSVLWQCGGMSRKGVGGSPWQGRAGARGKQLGPLLRG